MMTCPKCGRETPETAQFCIRCHATLHFVCPACKHPQNHGGNCESCGADFEKYAMMLEMQMAHQAQAERQRYHNRAGIVRQIALLPVTGGLSLLKYLYDRTREG